MRRPMTKEDLARRTRVEDLVTFSETEDPEEIARRVRDWERQHGELPNILLWCGPQVITSTGEPTTVVVVKGEKVVACGKDGPDIVPFAKETWRRRVSVERLPYMSYCLLPLATATNRPEDAGWLVRVRKIGATRLIQAGPGPDLAN